MAMATIPASRKPIVAQIRKETEKIAISICQRSSLDFSFAVSP